MLALSAALALPGLAAAQQAPAEALSYFAAKAKAQGLSAADVANPLVTSSYLDAAMGLTHTYLLQRVNGVPIFGATGDVHTDKNGKVVSSYQAFVAGAAASAPSATPTLSAADAVVAAATALGLSRPVGLAQTDDATSSQGVILFNKAGISESDIPVQLMYARTATGLVLVWNVTIAQLDQQHYWNARVDAHTGRLVDKNDYEVSEQATFNQFAQRKQAKQQRALAFSEAATATTSLLSPTNTTAANSVTVIPFPLESPGQGNRAVVAMPSVGNQYSPYGWAVGQSFGTFAATYSQQASGKYLTRGNNVAAYDDNSTTTSGTGTANFNSSTTSPDGGPTMSYDFPFVQASGPRANLNPAITNLFYVNNMMHDVMMAHGFDEASGNFQNKNVGSGAANDQVLAEAQDGSGRNNANFSTPNDGASGRMQMYLWDNQDQSLTITAPSSIAGTYRYQPTTLFGADLSTISGGVCGNIVPVNDGTALDGGVHGCATTYVNAGAVNGNIALIERRGCTLAANNTFAAKVKNAQLNGATMAIVFNNTVSDTLFTMSGTDNSITIPAIFISGRDGAKIRAALTGSNVAVGCAQDVTGADWDGSLDNGVMAHEYGHGISNRLTGGPANSSCVVQGYTSGTNTFNTQCPGEGWSDFFALWMTTKATDNMNTKRFMATYVIGAPSATGPGLRAYPYTFSMDAATGGNPQHYGLMTQPTTNPLTYYQETHGLGEIWTSVLWDLNWQFINKYGYNADFYAATGGNNKFLKLVLDGCKIQPCNPSFLQARNAILKVDSLNNLPASPNRALIWTVFARRGMGYSANGGTRANSLPMLNVTEAFDMPPGLAPVALATRTATTNSALEAYPNPAENRLTVRTQLSSAAPVQVTMLDLLGKTVLAPVAVPAAQMQQSGTELDISQLASGIYIVRVATTEGTYTTKVTVQH